jgi:hypothetical protein
MSLPITHIAEGVDVLYLHPAPFQACPGDKQLAVIRAFPPERWSEKEIDSR